jgi:hypothetical protein
MPETRSTLHRLHLPIRLGRQQRLWAYGSFFALWSSGALWLVFHYFLQVQGDFGPRPHILESWWLKIHGLAMMIALLTLGSLLLHHLHRAWQLRKNRILGATLAGVFLWLGITGYALFYFSSDANQAWLPILHWLPGLALPLVLVWHVRMGKKRKGQSPTVVKRTHPWPTTTEKRAASGHQW